MSYIREEYKDSDALAKKKSDYGVLETKTPTLDPAYNQKVALSDDILNQLKNKKFSYDINGDALYHQYKNQYAQQGKLASQDTMAQAAAMTGGYGNSYAATAGNQAYQGYLTKLNDVIPELYHLPMKRTTFVPFMTPTEDRPLTSIASIEMKRPTGRTNLLVCRAI